MNEIVSLKKILSESFCQAIAVRALPSGFAVSAPFRDNSGDRLSFFAHESDGHYILQDDGFYLSHLVASGVDIERGQRQQLLDGILDASSAYWDRDTYEIRSQAAPIEKVGNLSVQFLSALMRIRDIELLTKDMVRSTFKEDATNAILERFSGNHQVDERASLDADYLEYPADIVLRPKKHGGRQSAIFFVNSPTQFLEAELLHGEIEKKNDQEQYSTIALIEDAEKLQIIGLRRYQRAVNRGLPTPIFRGDEKASIGLIERRLAA